jgi:amidophosphoribosyltransferase
MGIADDQEAASLVIDGLKALQHRGSASTGIAGYDEVGKAKLLREPGMASSVYSQEATARIGAWGLSTMLGQDRYATSGPWDRHLQPVSTDNVLLSHNGNSSMPNLLAEELTSLNVPHDGTNDSEMATLLINDRLKRGADIPDAISMLMDKFKGSLSCVALVKNSDGVPVLTAFRDRHGVRPLVIGRTKNGGHTFASETHGLDAIGASYIRDVNPGEIVFVENGELKSDQVAEPDRKSDIFELIYFSHPDSLFHGVRIGDIRREFGRELAAEYSVRHSIDPDSLVVAVPKSAEEAAKGFAEALGLEHQPAITKDQKLGRSFMEPTQRRREKLRDRKYHFNSGLIKGRKIIGIDDSMVRNTTAPYIVKKLKEYGAESVGMQIASPPIRFSNFYGVDTPRQQELAAANFTIEEMRVTIDSHNLGFLSLRGLMRAVKKITGQNSDKFELSAINGQYPIPIGKRRIYLPVSNEYSEWVA